MASYYQPLTNPFGDLHTSGGRFQSPHAGSSYAAVLEPWLKAHGIPYYEARRNYYNLPSSSWECYEDPENKRSEVYLELHCNAHPLVTVAVVRAAEAVARKCEDWSKPKEQWRMPEQNWEDITPIADAMIAGSTGSLLLPSGLYAHLFEGDCKGVRPEPMSDYWESYWRKQKADLKEQDERLRRFFASQSR